MRCGCAYCGTYMIHAEASGQACRCPECRYSCNACLGTDTVLSPQQLRTLNDAPWLMESLFPAETDEVETFTDGLQGNCFDERE